MIALLIGAATPALALSPIHAAVAANDPTAVRTALSDGADINESNEIGQTPIVEAALADKLRAAAALMKKGADASTRSAEGLTPMEIAAQRGYGKIVRMLLRYGVDTNEKHSEGLTPFHRACLGADAGHTDAVFAFLDAGVAPDQPSGDNRMPIEMSGNENTRKLLSEALQEKRRRGHR